MSQRNPLNDRYQTDEVRGKTRKSAASAKPKSQAAASVVVKAPKKTPKERREAEKAARKKAQAEQRELDRKYYTPDTDRYRKLRKIWWALLVGAVLCTVVSFFFRSQLPEGVALAVLLAAYALIIAAFYIDFSKIRKERRAYQTKMLALEEKQKREAKEAARANAGKQGGKGAKGGKGGAKKVAEIPAEEAEKVADEAPNEKPKRSLFGRKKTDDAAPAAKADDATAADNAKKAE